MVAFLDKPFEFTTSLSMKECVARLEAKSTRGIGFLASPRDILVLISDDNSGKNFVLDRTVVRGSYAKVQGYIVKNVDNSVQVSGFGRVPFFILFFSFYMLIATIFFAYVFRSVPLLSLFFLLFTLASPISLRTTIRNRNDLIKTVYQALYAD